jgi:hypothetical protein
MTGDKGTLYLADRPEAAVYKDDLLLDGHIQGQDSNGMSFSCPRARYSSRQEKIFSGGGWFENRFLIRGKDFVCTGVRFEVDRGMTAFVGHGGRLRRGSGVPDAGTGGATSP